MQILITTSVFRQPKVLQFTPWTLGLTGLALLVPMMVVSLVMYHAIVLKAAHEKWPVISEAMQFFERQELAQRDRYMRENLDAMASKVGDLQARLLRLEAVNERLAGRAGMKPDELKQIQAEPTGGAGGPLTSLRDAPVQASMQVLAHQLDELDALGDRSSDVLALIESRLFETRLTALMVPSTAPVSGPVGSHFGFRTDPITHHPALHTGLDFPGAIGTPIVAAAGGVVVSTDEHPQYGHLLELDHGNGLLTRYAHTSRIVVRPGDLVKRGQKVAEIGNTGRSTGPHLHFEVMVDGVLQNPAKFLTGTSVTH
ncbi:MAG TPA: M23 family metallopeptidase [Aquabacterium sp.]|nr:M23 family metallopeptidase [Aquabacterium sp.]